MHSLNWLTRTHTRVLSFTNIRAHKHTHISHRYTSRTSTSNQTLCQYMCGKRNKNNNNNNNDNIVYKNWTCKCLWEDRILNESQWCTIKCVIEWKIKTMEENESVTLILLHLFLCSIFLSHRFLLCEKLWFYGILDVKISDKDRNRGTSVYQKSKRQAYEYKKETAMKKEKV